MLDEFKILIESEKVKIQTVLKPHLDEKIFKRLLGGFFDESKTRFMAFAFFPVKKDKYYEYNYLFELSGNGHSANYYLSETHEKTRKYIDENHFQYKSIEGRIEEGLYKSILITYIGEFDYDEWNILRDSCFSDIKDVNRSLQSKVINVKTSIKNHFFERNTFQETSEHYQELMSYSHTNEFDLPIIIPAHLRPYIGHSNLVSLVRTEKTSKLNLSFQDYVRKAVYAPLIINLKTYHPDKYQAVWGFYGTDCNFLTPSHRRFCLLIFVATDNRKKKSVAFYLYSFTENKLYKWTYFQKNPHSEKYDYDLIERILAPISAFDSMDYIIDPQCNFNDEKFWDDFVFKMDNDRYLYLEEENFSKS